MENHERVWLPKPEFEHLFYIEVGCKPPIEIGPVAEGRLLVQPIESGRFFGKRMNGVVLDSGADWSTIRNDGIRLCDTRYVLETDDGAHIAMDTLAHIFKDPVRWANMVTEPLEKNTPFYYREYLHFTTGDERYSWLNGAVAFGVCSVINPVTICYDAYILK